MGHVSDIQRGRSTVPRGEVGMHDTFRNAPDIDENDIGYLPALSAPVGFRKILAEVRAPRASLLSAGAARQQFFVPTPSKQGKVTTPTAVPNASTSSVKVGSASASVVRSTGGTMSKGGMGVKSIVQVDQLAWLNNVKVGSKRGSSSGGGSHVEIDSAAPSRLGSISRAPSGPDRSLSEADRRHSSGSAGRGMEERNIKDSENNQSLHDE